MHRETANTFLMWKKKLKFLRQWTCEDCTIYLKGILWLPGNSDVWISPK